MKPTTAQQILNIFRSEDWAPLRSRSYELSLNLNTSVLEQMIIHALFRSPQCENAKIVSIALEHDGNDVGVFIYHSGNLVWQKVLSQVEILKLFPGGNLANWFYFSEVIDELISIVGPVINEMLNTKDASADWYDTAGLELEEFADSFQQSIQDGAVVYFEEGDNCLTNILHSVFEQTENPFNKPQGK